jgi:hypothetical protein
MQDRDLARLSSIVDRITGDSHLQYQEWLSRALGSQRESGVSGDVGLDQRTDDDAQSHSPHHELGEPEPL